MIEGLEKFRDMASRGELPERYLDKVRRLIDELHDINHSAKVRRYKVDKLRLQVEHYGLSMAARRGLRGLRIKVEIEGAE